MIPLYGQTISWLPNVLATAAQATEQAPASATSSTGASSTDKPATSDSPLGGMLPLLAILAVFFYLVVLRPQKKEKQKRQQMLDTMKKGDRVVTIGGMHGKVADMNEAEKTVSVEVAPKTIVKFSRAAVQTVEPRGSAREGQDKDEVEPSK